MQSLQRNHFFSLFCAFLLSLCCVGFGRPSDFPLVSYAAATIGYALFWQQCMASPLPPRNIFCSLWLLFAFSSLLQTRWLLSHPYSYIILIWLFLSCLLSFPYAYLVHLFLRSSPSFFSLLPFSALFACLDAIETHLFFCGISFRSPGAFLMGNPFSSQLITLLGGIGLAFLVFFMNGAFLLIAGKRKPVVWSFLLFLAPIALGECLTRTLPTAFSPTPLKVALFHFNHKAVLDLTVRASIQEYKETWKEIFSSAPLLVKERVDLVLLPEGVVPYSSQTALFRRDELPEEIAHHLFNHDPFVSSGEIAQALSLLWKSPILLGMERKSLWKEHSYFNTCFLYSPDKPPLFYDKQVLVPGGEYVPMEEIFKPILLRYGIGGSFQAGRSPVLLPTAKASLFPLICYEETLSQYVLPAISLNADLLVSLSNDHWFPSPLFAKEHQLLGKMRAMESGLSLLRCANMGRSGLILADGTEFLSMEKEPKEGPMIFSFVPVKRKTPYSFLKAQVSLLILFVCAFGSIPFLKTERRKRKLSS